MRYRFDVTFLPSDAYRAQCGDVVSTTTRGLARLLVEQGAADGPIEGGRLGKIDWTVASLHRWAAGAVLARDDTATMHPALAAAVDALRAERAQRKESR